MVKCISLFNNMIKAEIRSVEIPRYEKIPISKEFGNAYSIRLNKKSERCVDPRHPDEISTEENALSILNQHRDRMPRDYQNSVAIPGGFFAYPMILIGARLDLTPHEAVDLSIKWHEKEEIPISYHTDREGHGFGCGHVRLASQKENENLYKVNSDDVKKILEYTEEKVNSGKIEVEESVLKDKHTEQFVGKIKYNEKNPKTVKSTTDTGVKFFRLDETAAKHKLASLASFIHENASEVIGKNIEGTVEELTEKFEEVFDGHTNVTLGLLAASLQKELPILELDYNEEKPAFKEIGKVTPIPQRA